MSDASQASGLIPDVLSPFREVLSAGPTFHGDLVWFRQDDPVGKALSLYGEWAREELSLLLPMLRSGDVVLDIGSYVGTHAVSFAGAVGVDGKVWAFEPQPVVVDVLRANAASARGSVEVVHAAVGQQDGTVEVVAPAVFDRGNFGAASLLNEADEADSAGAAVPIVTIDGRDLARIRLMKIDVEGMEQQVLRGALRTLAATRPVVYAECNSIAAGGPVLTLLQEQGYRLWLHRPAAYSPDNFRGVTENVFGVACESNLLALPVEAADELLALIDERHDIVPAPDLDALAHAVMRTPRFGDASPYDRNPDELLLRLTSAENDLASQTCAWRRRLEELELQSAAAARERDDERSRAAAESERAGAAERQREELRVALAREAQARKEVSARLRREAAAHEQQAARADAFDARLSQARADATTARARVHAIEGSTAWRVTAPLRAVGTARREIVAHPVGRVLRLVWLLLRGRLRRELTTRKHLRLLGESGLFDEQLYVAENADVPATGALEHYLLHGGFEGRRPNTLFDAGWYQSSYPDVVTAGVNPLLHYALSGAAEGRDPGPGFSTSFYVGTNEDVRAAGINPLAHYLAFGRLEGRPSRPPHEADDDGALAVRPTAPSRDEWVALQPRDHGHPEVVVVVPVYRGFDETLRCLYSVLASPVSVPYRLLVVNDCSPEPELAQELEWLSSAVEMELLVNQQNLGFVGSVNCAIHFAEGLDVVLLNSDTEVYGDWLDRLRAVAHADRRCGTVTPFTNSGTIASYPRFVWGSVSQLEIGPDEVDRLAAEVLADEVVEVPTCVGFCVYIRRECLADVGLFDEEAFGRGYGEENDFSLRAAARGWRNVLTGSVFVRHYGSTSFGEAASALQRAGLQVLNRRYPGYDRLIAAYIAEDPASRLRRKLDVARLQRARGGRPSFLLVSHALGGGTKRHLEDLAAALDQQGFLPVVLRPEPDGTHVRVGSPAMGETPNLVYRWEQILDPELLCLLRSLDVQHMHVHHLQGYQLGAEGVVMLAEALERPFDVTLHDWMTVCPRIDMVDDSRRFCGGPGVDKCRSCIARNGSPFGRPDTGRWQARHLDFLLRARRVFAPSADTAKRMKSIWPALRVDVRPHAEQRLTPAARPADSDDGLLHVAVLGAVGISKGSEILLPLAEDARARDLPIRYHVFGYTDRDARFRHLTNVSISGRYDAERLPRLVAESRSSLALFPAVWPETYSYTLSEAVDLGLHPVAFDIGAVAERMMSGNFGTVLPWALVDNPTGVNDRLLAIQPDGAPLDRPATHYADLLQDYYELSPERVRTS